MVHVDEEGYQGYVRNRSTIAATLHRPSLLLRDTPFPYARQVAASLLVFVSSISTQRPECNPLHLASELCDAARRHTWDNERTNVRAMPANTRQTRQNTHAQTARVLARSTLLLSQDLQSRRLQSTISLPCSTSPPDVCLCSGHPTSSHDIARGLNDVDDCVVGTSLFGC